MSDVSVMELSLPAHLLDEGPPGQYNERLQKPSAVEAHCNRSHGRWFVLDASRRLTSGLKVEGLLRSVDCRGEVQSTLMRGPIAYCPGKLAGAPSPHSALRPNRLAPVPASPIFCRACVIFDIHSNHVRILEVDGKFRMDDAHHLVD